MAGRREEILDAAMAVLDERGIEALSMRAVADRVGVTAMALYRHVADKSALLDEVVGRLLTDLIPAESDGVWQDRLAALAYACRDLTRRHPWAAQLLFSRPAVTVDAARAVDVIYLALLEAGVPESEVPRLERLVSTFVLGFVASENSGRFSPGDADPRSRRSHGQLPGHQRLAKRLELPLDLTAEFQADLADLLCLIEAVAKGPDRSGSEKA